MAEDKYAPKPHDDAKEIHNLHRWQISDHQAANKKEREEAAANPKDVQKKKDEAAAKVKAEEQAKQKTLIEANTSSTVVDKAVSPPSEPPGGHQSAVK